MNSDGDPFPFANLTYLDRLEPSSTDWDITHLFSANVHIQNWYPKVFVPVRYGLEKGVPLSLESGVMFLVPVLR